jgi:tetratricopeptide (TPR) repeat protein
LLLVLGLPPVFAETEASLRDRALATYDAGRYAEALPLLEQLDAAGQVEGTLLYRLYYCQRQAGDGSARETLDRARKALELEAGSSPDLEAPFYLANAYRNVGRITDAQRVAAEATGRVERGELPRPETGIEMFRVGKLYADQELDEQASKWYARAVESLASDMSATAGPYLEWAGRYLAERAWKDEDYAAAAQYLAVITADQRGTDQDLDRLAVAYSRLERYSDAKAAWQAAERRNPTQANRPRYCWRLAAQAESLGSLPSKAPDGRDWADLSKEDLEKLMADKSKVVRDAQAEVEQSEKMKKKQLRKLQEQVDAIRPVFIGAAMEYALRGYGIRETAFFGGYAPLIFHAKQWKLPAG